MCIAFSKNLAIRTAQLLNVASHHMSYKSCKVQQLPTWGKQNYYLCAQVAQYLALKSTGRKDFYETVLLQRRCIGIPSIVCMQMMWFRGTTVCKTGIVSCVVWCQRQTAGHEY